MFDYRDLLKRYMSFVAEVEGTDFVGPHSDLSMLFSDLERAELRAVSAESTADDRRRAGTSLEQESDAQSDSESDGQPPPTAK